jgi:hypothetical protein
MLFKILITILKKYTKETEKALTTGNTAKLKKDNFKQYLGSKE